jgi:hypothetical protein
MTKKNLPDHADVERSVQECYSTWGDTYYREYDEVVSRLHNPLVLSRKFEAAGFASVRTLLYHFHCLPPIVSDHVQRLFREQSLAMGAHLEDWRGYLMASAFCIVPKKP